MDDDDSGIITFNEVDHECCVKLREFHGLLIEKYGSYDYTVGKCTAAVADMDTVEDELVLDHTVQSWSIEHCDKAKMPDDTTWQDLIGDGSDTTVAPTTNNGGTTGGGNTNGGTSGDDSGSTTAAPSNQCVGDGSDCTRTQIEFWLGQFVAPCMDITLALLCESGQMPQTPCPQYPADTCPCLSLIEPKPCCDYVLDNSGFSGFGDLQSPCLTR